MKFSINKKKDKMKLLGVTNDNSNNELLIIDNKCTTCSMSKYFNPNKKIDTEEEWIEVYGYKGLNEFMIGRAIDDKATEYLLGEIYSIDPSDYNINSLYYKGFPICSELKGAFENHDPLKHSRYFYTRAIVRRSDWIKLINKKALKDKIYAREIELLEEVKLSYDKLMDNYDYSLKVYNETKLNLASIFPNEDKWLEFYNDKDIDLHQFIIRENYNKLKNNNAISLSDSFINIILNKIEEVTIDRYHNTIDLSKNLLIYNYVDKIIELLTIDNINKETILKLLCRKQLF